MNRQEAEDYIYESYMLAEKEWEFNSRDEKKRNPFFSKKIIEDIGTKPAITVTGSKGKGSVANMIAQMLSSKKKVGLMTSPHIVDFNERFKVANTPITDEEFVLYAEKTRNLFAEVQAALKKGECISPVGIQCVIALLFFGDKETDINIFEGGKGVKYDDVNNIPHDYSVINTIFLEHTRELGNSLKEIAEDKACIITGREKCVYVAEQKEEVYQIVAGKADLMQVPMKVYGRDFYAENINFTKHGMKFDVVIGQKVYKDIVLPLLGEHQAKNCALAMALCADMIEMSEAWDVIRDNLCHLEWPGRMEMISYTPFILLDACINRESAYNVERMIRKLRFNEVICIIGIPDDKDYVGVASVMTGVSKHIILTKASNRHYIFTDMQRDKIEKELGREGLRISATQEIMSAIHLALPEGKPIVILGTTSLIADVKRTDIREAVKHV